MKILIRFFVLAFVGNFAQGAENCDDTYYVDVTLQNGSRWDMCWEHRSREGIVFHHIYYTPNNGGRKMILNQASVAQIHVPYVIMAHGIMMYQIMVSVETFCIV